MWRKNASEIVPATANGVGINVFDALDVDQDDEYEAVQPQMVATQAPETVYNRRGEYSKIKTATGMIKTIGWIAAGSLVVGVAGYATNVAQAFAFHNKTVAKLEAGKGNVLEINTQVGPIRIGGFVTKATTEASVGKELTGPFGIDIHYANQYILRQDQYETNLVINPNDIEIAFNQGDPMTPKDDKLTLTIKNGAIGTETRLAPKNGATTIDSKSDISAIPFEQQKMIADAIAEKMGTYATQVPAFGGGAKAAITLQGRMEQVADAYLGVQTDQKCTEQVASIDSFKTQIEKNFRIAVRTKLLDPTIYANTTNKDLLALENMSLKQVTALTDHAGVILEKDYAKNIVPDQKLSNALASFQKNSGIKTTIKGNKAGETGFTCGISKSAKMSLIDQSGNVINPDVVKK